MALRPSRFGDEFRLRLTAGAGHGWDNFLDLAEEALNRSTPKEQIEGLILAGRLMSRMYAWRGSPVDPSDPMGWPRTGIYDDAGNPIQDVPQPVQSLAQILAGAILGGIADTDPDPALTELFRGHVGEYLDQGLSAAQESTRH